MDKWTEFKTAYRLAKLGTLTATADDLGIHRTTVMRHIDVLEQTLGIKLFQRNDKGYIATESGRELMRLGEITDLQFSQFANKAKIKEEVLEGTLKITCVNELTVYLIPAMKKFRSLHPKISFEILADARMFDLEYGEADLAIRTGPKPQTLDNIVLPFATFDLAFCAHRSYIAEHGLPTAENFREHKFIAVSERFPHLPWNEWIYEQAGEENIVLRSASQQVMNFALHGGQGISIYSKQAILQHPELVELQLGAEWTLNTWILVHRDIIHIPKVKHFIEVLKQQDNTTVDLTRL